MRLLYALAGCIISVITFNIPEEAIAQTPLSAPIILPADLSAIKANPNAAAQIFPRYESKIRQMFPAWQNAIDYDGMALIFATAVAYQSAAYGPDIINGNAAHPDHDSIQTMLNYDTRECFGDALLISKLYQQILKRDGSWTVYMLGFYYNPSFGNHVEVFAVSSYGANMILDGNAGIVSQVGLGSLPTETNKINVITERYISNTNTIDEEEYPLRTAVYNALTKGIYYYDQLIYQIDTSVYYYAIATPNSDGSYPINDPKRFISTDMGRLYTALYVLPAAQGWTRTPTQNWRRFGALDGFSFPVPPIPPPPPNPPPDYTYFSLYYWRVLDAITPTGNYYCFSQWSIWPVGEPGTPSCG